MDPTKVDYSLYLVTDNTPAILGSKDLVQVVKGAVEGGTTIVQLRDKTSETSDLIRIATSLRKVCHENNVAFVVNDRVDVALASGADGVHLGQEDMNIVKAREILSQGGKTPIIGATVSSIDEAKRACEDGADYLGIGTVFATPTKENTKSIIGTAGTQAILQAIEALPKPPSTVCIGGINASNLQRVLYQTTTPKGTRLSGVAVVSAIMAAPSSKAAAGDLLNLTKNPPPFVYHTSALQSLSPATIISVVPSIIAKLANTKPLCHNMTNLVVQNFAANVAICIGASPIMSNNAEESADLAALSGSLVVNMGTATADARQNYLTAVKNYNAVGGPVLLDPVGAGATAQRREGTRALLAGGYFDVIKGNEGEIRTVAGAEGVKQRGVDSGASTLDLKGRVALVKSVAARERCVVLMTGVTDVVSDGTRTVGVSNGHALLGEITGSGCTLGTTVASVLAVEREDKLLATVAALLIYEIAAQRAAARQDVKGPGTFVPAFLDELYAIREESLRGDTKWAEASRVEIF
ncbi:hypothetical protein CAC42_8265 [Sphaceloma murrayae]|uniref:Thiamine phosphate synthase/TenI domain-containing protein n=1 Tax=Sphaceloma murrayae TaxID=2082308 RepID=A0A2K1QJB8_9PEZI|nr:hypothetical protein CAC42_8265 [Sphaceloma murrayae]